MILTNWYKANPSIQWLIERAPTEEILIELAEHAVKLKASDKTKRRWADAIEVRFRWLKINPPTFEKVSVAEMLATPALVNTTFEAEGFEAQRAGKTMEDCPYDIESMSDELVLDKVHDVFNKETEWRAGFLRAQETPLPVVDDRPAIHDPAENVATDVAQAREWFCAENGIFGFEGPRTFSPDGKETTKQVSIHEYFGLKA